MSCWNWAILQIYFCTSSILLEIFWFPKFVTLKNNLNLYVSSILWVHQEFSNNYTSSILWTCFWNAFVFLFWVRSILEVDFQNLCIYCQTQKYTLSRLSKLTNLHSKLEVYLKYTFELICIDLNFFQTQTYTWGGLTKFYIQTQKYTSRRLSV